VRRVDVFNVVEVLRVREVMTVVHVDWKALPEGNIGLNIDWEIGLDIDVGLKINLSVLKVFNFFLSFKISGGHCIDGAWKWRGGRCFSRRCCDARRKEVFYWWG
jgi:hypothetical protein